MPLLDIQQRFRELGRIRLGMKQPTGKVYEKGPNKGKPVERPMKLPRFRITSPAKHLIEACGEAFGGEVKAWDNDGASEWEVIVEVAELPVLVPPGEIFSQWYELWSGGGCEKRCDGLRQVLKDAACTCPKDPEERTAEAAKGKACKPTTRLNLMLPEIPDLGVWRLESHGYYAAVELAPAAELCELATRRGAMIPADLRLVAREGARRPGEIRKKFFVPAISFRGALGPVLEALGMDTTGPALLLGGVERRPALDTGGRAELPAGAAPSFGPGPPVEEAKTPAATPDLPDAPFEPPLGGAPDEPGGADSALSRAQTIAIRCREFGVDRAHLIEAITSGRESGSVTSGKDVTPEEASEVFGALVKLRRNVLELVETAAGWRLIAAGTQYERPPLDDPVPEDEPRPDAASIDDDPPPDPEPPSDDVEEPEQAPPPAPPAEAVKPDEVRPPPPSDDDNFDGVGDEARWTPAKWRRYLAARGVTVGNALREARRIAGAMQIEPPADLDAILGNASLCGIVRGYVEEVFAEKSDAR